MTLLSIDFAERILQQVYSEEERAIIASEVSHIIVDAKS